MSISNTSKEAFAVTRMGDAESCFRQMVLRSFPADSRIITIPRQVQLLFAISWPLRWQFRRPDNPPRSRIVRLGFSETIVDQYELSPELEKRETENQVQKMLKKMLADFDPVPERTDDSNEEIVSWEITLDHAPAE